MAALFVGSLLLAFHHQAAVLHFFCTDHGKLIHLHKPPPSEALRHADPVAIVPDAAHLHGAHGCTFLCFLTQSCQPQRADSGHSSARAEAPSCKVQARVLPPSIPLLRQSPKHSPPLV